MAPETRSRGVPPPSRVYHSTPTLQQAQFPPRRKVVRTYGKRTPKSESRTLRQQTLTQIDFVSSFEKDDPIELTDSEAEEFGRNSDADGSDGNKENRRPEDDIVPTEEEEEEEEEEDEPPVSSGRKRRAASAKQQQKGKGVQQSKRRRTLGDDTEKKKPLSEKRSRRKTLGDQPSSSFHTQTLTQLFGNEELIKASDDEEADGGFTDWLGDPTSPSPRNRTSRSILKQLRTSSPSRPPGATAADPSSPATSVIPQTPAKRLRFEIPSSSQQATPLSSMLDRYGPPDKQTSPLKQRSTKDDIIPAEFTGKPSTRRRGTPRPKPQKLVIEDTFATESWGSATSTPTKSGTSESRVVEASSSMPDVLNTPTKPRQRDASTELGNRGEKALEIPATQHAPPVTRKTRFLDEIPDSDEDDEPLDEEDVESRHDGYDAGVDTQFAMDQIADLEDARAASTDSRASMSHQAIPQAVETNAQSGSASTTQSPTERELPPQPRRRRLRTPLHHPSANPTLTQPLESQRVALHILQDFPPATNRTDILISIEPSTLSSILEGYQTHVLLSFKTPVQAVRFWLYDGTLLRYMACPGSSERVDDGWQYHLNQVYELNNPVDREEMQEDGWIDEEIGRYVYLPPAVVGQLLWNLRHAMFDNDGEMSTQDEETASDGGQLPTEQPPTLAGTRSAPSGKTPDPSLTVSQQLEEQIQSDIAHSTQFPTSDEARIPSTPDEVVEAPSSPVLMPPPMRSSPHAPQHQKGRNTAVRPSQATTASQASTYDPPSSASKLPPHLRLDSSDTIVYQDYGESVAGQLPPDLPVPDSSQVLLSKSQMLSDSLLQDDDRAPPEIWDSEDDAEEQL